VEEPLQNREAAFAPVNLAARKLDERLGKGEGKQVLEALDKVLQNMAEPKPERAEPEPEE